MLRKALVKILVVTVVLFPVAASAEIKIGFVNMVGIMEKSPQAESARKALEKEFSDRDKKLTAVRDQILALEEQLKKDGAIMSDKRRTELEKQIVNKKRDYNRQQDELREDFNLRRNEELGKLQKNVQDVIVNIARTEKYDLIVTQPVLYASDRINLTNRVLEELGKDNNQEAAE